MPDHLTIRAANAGHTYAPGARVLDTESGLEGVVERSRFDHVLSAPGPVGRESPSAPVLRLPEASTLETVTVRLDSGSVIDRASDALIALPSGVDLEAFAL